jgi:hypothetical protein
MHYGPTTQLTRCQLKCHHTGWFMERRVTSLWNWNTRLCGQSNSSTSTCKQLAPTKSSSWQSWRSCRMMHITALEFTRKRQRLFMIDTSGLRHLCRIRKYGSSTLTFPWEAPLKMGQPFHSHFGVSTWCN